MVYFFCICCMPITYVDADAPVECDAYHSSSRNPPYDHAHACNRARPCCQPCMHTCERWTSHGEWQLAARARAQKSLWIHMVQWCSIKTDTGGTCTSSFPQLSPTFGTLLRLCAKCGMSPYHPERSMITASASATMSNRHQGLCCLNGQPHFRFDEYTVYSSTETWLDLFATPGRNQFIREVQHKLSMHRFLW